MKLFGTDGIRGIANQEPLTVDLMIKVGKAVTKFFSEKKPTILIGKDTRISCYMLESALTAGIISMGGNVLLVGPMPTPAIALLTKSLGADAGIMITASHNPAEHNGVKIIGSDGFKLSDDDEEKIEKLISENNFQHPPNEEIGKAKRIDDAKGRYIYFVKSTINNNSLKGLKIVLDTANGAGYDVAPKIFKELGVELITINNKPDGLNINKDCGALHPDKLAQHVKENNADCGIALDGDADRLIMVDEEGNILNGDHIIALCTEDLFNKGKLKNNGVVVTQYTNLAFEAYMDSKGIKTIRVDNGDRYVVEEMKKNGFNIGGEQSGHIIFFDHSTTGDGILTAVKVLDIMKSSGKKASELGSLFKDYPQITLNIAVKEKKPLEDMPSVKEEIDKHKETLGTDGRIFFRYSGTESKARIMVEGKDQKTIEDIAEKIAEKLKEEQ